MFCSNDVALIAPFNGKLALEIYVDYKLVGATELYESYEFHKIDLSSFNFYSSLRIVGHSSQAILSYLLDITSAPFSCTSHELNINALLTKYSIRPTMFEYKQESVYFEQQQLETTPSEAIDELSSLSDFDQILPLAKVMPSENFEAFESTVHENLMDVIDHYFELSIKSDEDEELVVYDESIVYDE